MPIVLVRHIHGGIYEDWLLDAHFSPAEIKKDDESGYRSVIKVNLSSDVADTEFEIIGTLEAGYYIPNASFQQLKSEINYEQAIGLFRFAARQALAIRKKLLSYALEKVAKGAKQILKADSADLHFLFDDRRGIEGSYVYQVCTGRDCRRFLKSHLPRYQSPDSLGQRAIRDRKPKFVPDPVEGHDELALEKFNEPAFNDGFRATVAFPLFVGDKHGVLYVHFRKTHWFNDDEIGWVENFANNATTAIRHAINYKQIRDSADTLINLHSVVQSLANQPEADDLLRHIAGNTINILGADVVTVYEYSEVKSDFVPQKGDSDYPVKVGRLFFEEVKITYLDDHCGPKELVKWGKDNIYHTSNTREDQVMCNKERKPRKDGNEFFVIREQFKSSLGILLKVGQEIVGAMFVHYRRPYSFPKEDRKGVEIMASAAAIAIKNRRREVISEDFRKIITTPDLNELLKLIVKQAREITNSSVGEIRLLEGPPTAPKLVSRALHPEEKHLSELNSNELTKGITGWVARNKTARLVPDVSKDDDYEQFFSDLDVKSELCVPLLDKGENVLGTLLVDSVDLGKFTERDKRVLQVLADQAVIGLQNAESAEDETLINLGQLSSHWIHATKNSIGGVRTRLGDALGSGNIDSTIVRSMGDKILTAASELIEEMNKLREFIISDKPQSIDPQSIMEQAIKKSIVPDNIIVDNSLFSSNSLPEGALEQSMIGVFRELIQNAVHAMPNGGKLLIGNKVERINGNVWVVMWVHDTGKGISKEDQEKIFDLGFTKKPDGSGFGLWWVKRYLKRLKGNVTVESIEGKGTLFSIYLPSKNLDI
ncbi:MAG: hypothetical protein BWK78_06155 [Thiotrichaceae bacterium IS1]|nr:MAG: hypothetical protein BWK78_06155 [Thiotrichaceae bacterium IS1]